MRRSALIRIAVHCPHFQRPVAAQLNTLVDKLVSCAESERCRVEVTEGAPAERPFPRGCPVYPSLAK